MGYEKRAAAAFAALLYIITHIGKKIKDFTSYLAAIMAEFADDAALRQQIGVLA